MAGVRAAHIGNSVMRFSALVSLGVALEARG